MNGHGPYSMNVEKGPYLDYLEANKDRSYCFFSLSTDSIERLMSGLSWDRARVGSGVNGRCVAGNL